MLSSMNLPRGEKLHAAVREAGRKGRLGTPLSSIRTQDMKVALYSEFYLSRVYHVRGSRWVGMVKPLEINRYMKIELWQEDITLIEERLGRKLASRETFTEPLTVSPKRFTGHMWKNISNVSDGVTRITVLEPVQDIPKAIVPYGSLFAPVTYAPPQAVVSTPVDYTDDAFRQRLHNEMVTMVSVRYAPIGGGLSRWLAVATFENMEVHFPIYREHAAKFLQAGFAQLPKGTDVKPFTTEINVILEWNEVRHDLRIWAVLDKQGQSHKVGERKQIKWAVPNLKTGTGYTRDAQGNVIYDKAG